METIGAYEAKTHLSALLDRVASGERITITRRGVPVAVLTPVPDGVRDATSAAADLRRLRRGARLDGLTIREMIEEGRR
ncbi:type II toxin-antitoxin system Phd/YefM family antitoxin [Deferrisoma camini]|uniref:type II toxin-antitoxin system Phd/YefM family antitoxin n=1 Tax=Deferrisoma camini TaxID=1035120 RepID=UPI00046D83C9|nr:type II toxin-antitoxin system prevent-host-death family antitoxin [Deferrisoma camini]